MGNPTIFMQGKGLDEKAREVELFLPGVSSLFALKPQEGTRWEFETQLKTLDLAPIETDSYLAVVESRGEDWITRPSYTSPWIDKRTKSLQIYIAQKGEENHQIRRARSGDRTFFKKAERRFVNSTKEEGGISTDYPFCEAQHLGRDLVMVGFCNTSQREPEHPEIDTTKWGPIVPAIYQLDLRQLYEKAREFPAWF